MQTYDTEESKILNTNSCSSMINNINFTTTSNGSSLLDEKKYFMKKDPQNQNQNIPTGNNNLFVNSQILTCGDKSYTSSIHNNNISYTNSLDQSQFKNNNYVNNLQRNFNINNQFGNYNMCHDNNYFYKNNMQMYEYKSNNQKPQFKINLNLNDEKNIIDNLILITKDQNGCKLIQKKIEEKNSEFLNKFFDKVK